MTLPPLMILQFIIILCLGYAEAVRLDFDPDVLFQLQEPSAEDDLPVDFADNLGVNPSMDRPLRINNKPSLIKLLLEDRDDLMNYIRNNQKVKRTRQCYWSAVSCF